MIDKMYLYSENYKSDLVLSLQKKLKGESRVLFDKILEYINLKKGIKYMKSITPYDIFDEDGINIYAKFDEITNKHREDTEKDFNKYNKEPLLEHMSDILYWMAKKESEDIIKKVNSYLNSVAKEILLSSNRNKNVRKGLQTKSKLNIILGPSAENYDNLSKEETKNIDRINRGFGGLWVNIDNEIDISSSIWDADALNIPYESIIKDNNKEYRVIKEYTKCFLYNGKYTSLFEHYNNVKSKINKDWITNKNIINQIITIYLIKRSQNGDEEAFQILFNIYKGNTEKMEKEFQKKYNINVDGYGLSILTSILKGDSVKNVYEYLEKTQEEKRYVDNLNKKPYRAINDSINVLFNFLTIQKEILEEKMELFEKETKNLRNRARSYKKAKTKIDKYNYVIYKSCDLLSEIKSIITTTLLINPESILKISRQYNKGVFKPTKKGNLTTYLFGSKKGKGFNGKIWEGLKNKTKGQKTDNFVEYDDNKNYEDL